MSHPEDFELNETGNYNPVQAKQGEVRFSLLVYHRDGAVAVPLQESKPIVIGRSGEADLVLADEGISRFHAKFELVAGEVWVTDLGSTNNTLVKGQKVQHALLRSGEEAVMGGVTVTVHLLWRGESPLKGLDSHNLFMTLLDHECGRARAFQRSVAVVMVRAARQEQDLRRQIQAIQRLLRPIDRIALYSPDTAEILLPESKEAQALQLAQAIVEGAPHKRGRSLLCGVALCPSAASSADELVAVALSKVRCASPLSPICAFQSASRYSGSMLPQLLEDEEPIIVDQSSKALYELVDRLAMREIPLLVFGETGAGKEVVTRVLHARSQRKDSPLRCLNCGAIPDQLIESILFGHAKGAFTGAERETQGLFESANHGMLLLDEIGELSPAAQIALLRVIERRCITRVGATEEIPLDVRVIAATHRDLELMVAEGRFRQDLLYRINGMTLRVPPLRERRADILPLAETFLARASRTEGCDVRTLHPDVIRVLERYSWPGNVRELRNVIERAVVLCQGPTVMVENISEKVRALHQPSAQLSQPVSADLDRLRDLGQGIDFRERMQQIEAELIVSALRQANWNQSAAARLLRIPMRTLTRKMSSCGIRRLGYGVAED